VGSLINLNSTGFVSPNSTSSVACPASNVRLPSSDQFASSSETCSVLRECCAAVLKCSLVESRYWLKHRDWFHLGGSPQREPSGSHALEVSLYVVSSTGFHGACLAVCGLLPLCRSSVCFFVCRTSTCMDDGGAVNGGILMPIICFT